MNEGQRISGKTQIPVRDMALANLEQFFPQLTADQCEALRTGKAITVPPAEFWQASNDRRLLTLERSAALLEGLAGNVNGPRVSCVLVFANKERIRRARKAVNQFCAQSYPHKQLVIVNATDLPITNVAHKEIKELPFEVSQDSPTGSLGSMRNFALANCDGEAACPHWDDDDVYDRHLLAFMMSQYSATRMHAVVLSTQLRIDIVNSTVYKHTQPSGIPNTMIVPCRPNSTRYPDQTGKEDEAYFHKYFALDAKVIANTNYPFNTLKMCVYDGHNVAPFEEFMLGHATKEYRGRWEVTSIEANYVKEALEPFGLHVQPVRAGT